MMFHLLDYRTDVFDDISGVPFALTQQGFDIDCLTGEFLGVSCLVAGS